MIFEWKDGFTKEIAFGNTCCLCGLSHYNKRPDSLIFSRKEIPKDWLKEEIETYIIRELRPCIAQGGIYMEIL